MRLKGLLIKNFKGIPSFNMSLNGGATSVYGDNGTGKTTIADSINWLFFGKDSLNRADFEIKPIGSNGVETEVQAEFDSGMTLKKVYQEKWTKKRGSAQAEFTGHSIDHYIDGVPSKKKEFDEAIKAICDENLFKLLGNPRYFNEVLHWQDRRKTLLNVCGDITDADVFSGDPSLYTLPAILGKHSLDDYRKIIKARLPEINREIQKIPVRIDEVQSMISTDLRGRNTVESAITVFRGIKKAKEQELSQLENGGGIADLTKKLREAESALIDHDNAISKKEAAAETEKASAIAKIRAALQETHLKIQAAEREKARHEERAVKIPGEIEFLKKVNEALRADWNIGNAKEFEFVDSETCPTCGQSLPAEQVDAARQKALESFNGKKAKALEEISQSGKSNLAKIDALCGEMITIQGKIDGLNEEIKALDAASEAIERDLRVEQDKVFTVVDEDIRQALVDKIRELELDITAMREAENPGPAIEAKKAEISDAEAKISSLQTEILTIENSEKATARIDSLKKEERVLAAEYERLEGHLNLAEIFTRKKVSMLTEKINSKFNIARFKLFEEQINGGLTDCCECMVGGVPYSSLNNAARINVGIDIINTLSEYYGVSIPCFIDNAEAVTRLLESNSQQIKLIVSENDKTLRIEEV